MLDPEFLQKNWRTIVAAKWVILTVALAAAGGGWWFADYHYSGRIESLKEDIEHKEYPKPAPPTVKEVPTPDPAQAQEIAKLKAQLEFLEKQSRNMPRKTVPSVGNVTGSGNLVAPGSTGPNTQNNNFFGKPARHLDAKEKSFLLTKIPKDRMVGIARTDNTAEANDLANEIYKFMEENGYEMNKAGIPVLLGVPTRGVAVNLNPDPQNKSVEIIVGTNE